jgi:large subunit ribosomal protein L13Ae
MTSYEVPKCLIIDARDHILGRLAATVAKHLMMGTKIYVLRCERIVMAGHLIRAKLKFRAFRGHRMCTKPSRGPYHYRAPSHIFYRSVRGMIKHGSARGKNALRLLHCYDGMPPRFQHIRKVRVVCAYRALRLDPSRPFTRLGKAASEFGWKYGKLIAQMENKRKVKQGGVCRAQRHCQDEERGH